jgi:benzoate membrane transport protein
VSDVRGWISLCSASLTAVVVGFASTILLIVEAAKTVGADAAQQASWVWALCIGMAITTLILSWRYRMPIITAWSTPGAALILTSGAGIAYPEALGAFVAAGLLTCLAALLTPLARLIEKIPAPIAAAMLAGVLIKFCIKVPEAAQAMPWVIATLAIVFFALRMSYSFFALPAILVIGIASAALGGNFAQDCCSFGLTWPLWTWPTIKLSAIIGLGIPLFLVTMASQNLTGFAVLRAAGYRPPVSGSLWVTGIASVLFAPFGSHALNLAAITASIVTGPDSHPDPHKRWLVAWPYLVLYTAIGLGAASFVSVLGALPQPLITAIAGLALFAPLLGGITAMMKEPGDIEPALVTFLVTASGLSIEGVGSAFWGLVAGLLFHGARYLLKELRPSRSA